MKRNHPSSFKDPSGYIFTHKSRLYREIDPSCMNQYNHLMTSGLYHRLLKESLLIPHRENHTLKPEKPGGKIIEPTRIPYISYPYEWSFSQLKDAALATLKIQTIALEYGMSLRDASGFNIQFYQGIPVLIDTLSLGEYEKGKPWVAYRQFCEHFLAPLTITAYTNIHLSFLLAKFGDGIPLDVARQLIPWYRKIQPGIFFHIVLHGQNQQSSLQSIPSSQQFSLPALKGLVASLEATVQSILWHPDTTQWSSYSTQKTHTSYVPSALRDKERIVETYLKKIHPSVVLDIGANSGVYSKLAANLGSSVLSIDTDPSVVEYQYTNMSKEERKQILPLCVDIVNPTPGVGWKNEERLPFLGRITPDCIMALAVLHHLVIKQGVPLKNLAQFFALSTQWLIIEFVPKTDPHVQSLLRVRQDIFSDYTPSQFEAVFRTYFTVVSSQKIQHSQRTLYLFKRKHT